MSNDVFNNSIIISSKESEQTSYGTSGQLRFNKTKLKFEGYHSYPNSNAGADIFGNNWRTLTQDVASADELGIIRVGTNLTINPTTGILSAIASGVSRIHQLVITVSPIPGAADYQTINTAISNAIGTASGGYIDGSITSNLGGSPSPQLFSCADSIGISLRSTNRIVLFFSGEDSDIKKLE